MEHSAIPGARGESPSPGARGESLSPGARGESPRGQSPSPGARGESPRGQSPSPGARGESPRGQSPSPGARGESPRGQSPSPGARGESPRGQSPSPGARGESPRGQSPIPGARGESPRGQSPSPGARGESPRGQSPIPGARGESPRGQSPSPGARGESPRGESLSPGARGESPRGESPSPGARGESPRGESPSPGARGESLSPGARGESPSPGARGESPRGQSPSPGARGESRRPRGQSRSPGAKGESRSPRGQSPSPGARGESRSASSGAECVNPAAVDELQHCAAVKRKISLSGCEACDAAEAKYRCPRCMTYSCSLFCVKKHKAENGCNGVRDKTAFMPLSRFNEMHLLSDYRFLEDTGRLADSTNRDNVIHRPITSKSLNFMKNRARKFNIDLKLLPIGFTKRRENSTFFNKKEQMFYWHLKLVFAESHTEYTERRVSGSKMLKELLKKYVDPVEADPVIRQKLKVYTMASLSELRILMKVENRKSNSVRYYKLDSSQSLVENLSHKTIIEYPTLHIILKVSSPEYRLLNEDDSNEDSENSTDSSTESEEEEGEIRDDS